MNETGVAELCLRLACEADDDSERLAGQVACRWRSASKEGFGVIALGLLARKCGDRVRGEPSQTTTDPVLRCVHSFTITCALSGNAQPADAMIPLST